MAALQYADVPGYAALLLRRSYRDLSLPGALMARAEQWLRPTDARWDHETHSWRFPAGSTLTFGYLQYEGDKYGYQSAEFQFIGFDELTQFSESQYTYLFSRLRRPTCPDHKNNAEPDCPNCQRIAILARVPLRMRWASNPGGVGHEWVRQRMLTEGLEAGRPFVPAKLEDNPHVDRESYVRSLTHLDPITRAQLLAGDWTVRAEGKKFRREWFANKIVSKVPRATWTRFWDLAATEPKASKTGRGRPSDPDYTVGALMGRDELDRYYLAGMVRRRETPGEVERIIKTTAEADGKDIRVRMEQEPGASGKTVISHYRRRVVAGYDFKGIPATGNPELRVNPISSLAEAGDLYLVEGSWIGAWLDEAESYPGGAHDDQVIAAAGAYADLAGATMLDLPEGSIPSREETEDRRATAEPSGSGIRGREF